MRKNFQNELDLLNNRVNEMGTMVQKAIFSSVSSLENQDLELSSQTIDNDKNINQLYFSIESDCLRLINLQQPNAGDLRQIAAVLRIITDLERIGDFAVSISKVAIRLGYQEGRTRYEKLAHMSTITQKMIKDAIELLISKDRAACYELARQDEELDALHKEIYADLVLQMKQDPNEVSRGTQLLFVAHHLERVGDHLTNLAEWILYQITGEKVSLN